jgi:signal transduction histidine kinase
MSDRFTEPLVDALRYLQVFEDLDRPQRQWLADRMDDIVVEAGIEAFTQGEPAEHMIAFIAGEVHVWVRDVGEPIWFIREGDVSGLLPYSRMTVLRATGRTVRRTRMARLHKDRFPDLLRDLPRVGERLVWLMADRIREYAVSETHREKLMALGKLSAGLAHELNNPASAVQRAASQLCSLLEELQQHSAGAASGLSERLREAQVDRNPLSRSDRDRALRQWSRTAGYDIPREALGVLAEAGIEARDLAALMEGVPAQEVPSLLVSMTMAWRARGLVDDIEAATRRIVDLVKAIKEYAYRDETPVQAVDVQESLERTLLVFTPRTKHGVRIERDYAADLPRVEGNPGELTQIWTNLIDNALDAMQERGTLRVRTRAEGDAVLVEIGDSGPGIPEDRLRKIFEPFFTTKPLGEGTGLGLDIVRGIARRHQGGVRVLHSRPGDTVLQVRLSLRRSAAPEESRVHHVQSS